MLYEQFLCCTKIKKTTHTKKKINDIKTKQKKSKKIHCTAQAATNKIKERIIITRIAI